MDTYEKIIKERLIKDPKGKTIKKVVNGSDIIFLLYTDGTFSALSSNVDYDNTGDAPSFEVNGEDHISATALRFAGLIDQETLRKIYAEQKEQRHKKAKERDLAEYNRIIKKHNL